jgi:hypothetical protein
MLIRTGVQIKAVKGNALTADTDFSDERPHIGVEPVPVHAEISGCVAQPE